MMAKLFGRPGLTLGGLVCLLSLVQLASANPGQATFLIKGRKVSSVVDSLIQLNRFLSERLTAEQRCQRQAIVLNDFKKGSINQFEIADIALARKEDVLKRYNQINAELLRNLYIDAAREFMAKKLVDKSMLELVNCLKAGYRNRDAKARSFLNSEELNTILGQFETIMQQPIKLLLDGDASQSNLGLHSYHDSIKSTVGEWLGGDELKKAQLFGVRPPVQIAKPAHASARATSARGESSADAHANAGSRANSHASAHAGSRHGGRGANAHASANAGAAANSHADAEAYAPNGPNDGNAPVEVPPTETPDQVEMEHDEKEYIETLFSSLIAVYESLPLNAQLGDRCETYNRLIEAEREHLFDDDFLEHVVEDATKRIGSVGPSQSPFKPDKKTRADFLFVVEIFDPLRVGDEVWLDLNDCLANWVAEDEEVAKYMDSPKRLAIIDELTARVEAKEGPVETN